MFGSPCNVGGPQALVEPVDRQPVKPGSVYRQHCYTCSGGEDATAFREPRHSWVPQVRNNNVCTCFTPLDFRSPPSCIIARGMAIDICNGTFAPDVVAHIPGVFNVAADALSRRYQPGKNVELPSYLTPELELRVPDRPRGWWRTLPAEP